MPTIGGLFNLKTEYLRTRNQALFRFRFLMDPRFVYQRLRHMRSWRAAWKSFLNVFRYLSLHRARVIAANKIASSSDPCIPLNRPIEESRLFCSRPFTYMEIGGGENGNEVFVCCPSWLRTSIGDAHRRPFADIWNSPEVREIRASILNGSFRYCNATLCPHLRRVVGPVQRAANITDPEMKSIVANGCTSLPRGPRTVCCNYDRTCNLRCPSCRSGTVDEKRNEARILMVQHKIAKELLVDAETLYISGSGDPFASPHFLRMLKTLDRTTNPQLRIHLHTNGLLWTPKTWGDIPRSVQGMITGAEISIDAASPRSYALNRSPGRFDVLLRNFNFISGLRADGVLQMLRISMVVQENNFREMPDFVALGKRLQVDLIYFSQLVNWGTYAELEYLARAVHLPGHPRHAEFLNVLSDPILHDPIVDLGNLTSNAVETQRIPPLIEKTL